MDPAWPSACGMTEGPVCETGGRPSASGGVRSPHTPCATSSRRPEARREAVIAGRRTPSVLLRRQAFSACNRREEMDPAWPSACGMTEAREGRERRCDSQSSPVKRGVRRTTMRSMVEGAYGFLGRGGARCFAPPARSIPSEGPSDLPIRLRRTGLSPTPVPPRRRRAPRAWRRRCAGRCGSGPAVRSRPRPGPRPSAPRRTPGSRRAAAAATTAC